MAFTGNVFNRTYNWVTDANNGIPITPSRVDGDANDIAGGLTALAQGTTSTGYQQGSSGSVARTVAAKLQESASALDFGADSTGTTDSLAAFTSLMSASSAITVPTGNYRLSATWTPPAQDTLIQMAGGVRFTGSLPDFRNLIPWESTPITSAFLTRKAYDSTYSSVTNIFHFASYASTTSAYPSHVVALYSQGEALGANSKAFGANPVGIASNATATAIAIEVDPTVTVSGGTAYGLVIASTSWPGVTANFPNAIQIGSNGFTSHFTDGILLGFSDSVVDGGPIGCYTDNGLHIYGGGGAGSTCKRLFYSHGLSCTSATIDLPSLLVDGFTASTVANRVRITPTTTGTGPRIRADGTDTDIELVLSGKGTAAVQICDGSLNTKIAVSSSGIGLYGKAPIGRPVGFGTPTNASLTASFPGTSATLAQCGGMISYLLNTLLLARGDVGA